MEKTLKRSELEAQLSGKSEAIARRLQALQDEVGGLSIRQLVDKKPWLAVGAAVATGLVLGVLFGGKRSGKRKPVLHTALIEGYMEAIADDVRRVAGKGKDVGEAVAEALRERVPLIVYTPEEGHPSRRGWIGQTADLAFKAAAGFAVKAAIDYATTKIDVEKMLDDVFADAEVAQQAAKEGDVSSTEAP